MNATDSPAVDGNSPDRITAKNTLNKVRDDLAKAVRDATDTMLALRVGILKVRPTGVLTVDEMAEAVGRGRNYVDSVWSSHGDTTTGRQTRVSADVSEEERTAAVTLLADAARDQRRAAGTAHVARAERNRAVVMVYASRVLGPSAIAAEVGVDRNHVLRIARKAGVTPVHRAEGTVRNQHTRAKGPCGGAR